jgi:hypothetical protein
MGTMIVLIQMAQYLFYGLPISPPMRRLGQTAINGWTNASIHEGQPEEAGLFLLLRTA